MTSIEDNYGYVMVENERENLIKAQRNYLIKMYEITMEDKNELDDITEEVRKRWIELQQKSKLLNQVDQFKERYIESEIQIYQLSLERISRKIKEFNKNISHEIIQCNIQLGYDEIDFTGLQGWDQAVEGDVLNFHLPPEETTQCISELHTDAGRLSLRIHHFKRRVV